MSRKWKDRFGKYFFDPRRSTHNYLLQFTLSLFVTGPCFIDSFFAASTSEIVQWMKISHESFSLLISVPALTGVVSAITAVIASMYGSTLSSMVTASLSFVGAIIIAIGIFNVNYATVMIGRLIFVLFWSLLTSFQCVIIFRQFQGPPLAWVLSLQILAIRIGTAAGMFFAGPIIDRCGDIANGFVTAIFLSAISLASTFLFAYLYRGSSSARLIRPKMIGHKKRVSDPTEEETKMPTDAKILCAVIFLYYGGLTPFESFGVDYLTNQVGIDRDISGKMMSMVVMFSFFSPLIAPIFNTVGIQLKCTMVAQGVIALAMLNTLFEWIPYPLISLAVIGIGHLFCVNALWLSLAGVSLTEYTKAEAASMGYALCSLGTCLNTWTTGKIRDMYGDYTVAYTLLASSILVAMCGTFIVWYRKLWEKTTLLSSPKLDIGCIFDNDPITGGILPSTHTPLIDDYFSRPRSTY